MEQRPTGEPSRGLVGARFFDYSGVHHILGRTDEGYAIWRRSGGQPIDTFPLTDEGWTQAWRVYQELEASLPPVPTPAWKRGQPIPLHEMRLGQILDYSFKLYRILFTTLIPIMAFVLVPLVFLQNALLRTFLGPLAELQPGEPLTPQEAELFFAQAEQLFTRALLVGGIALLVGVLVSAFLTGAVVRAAADAYLGERATIGGVARAALRRVHSILWVTVLLFLSMVAVPILVGVLLALTGDADLIVTGFVLAGILVIFPGLFFFVRFVFGPSVVMIEDLRGTGALRRSWQLSKGFGWRIFGISLLASLLVAVLGIIPGLPFNIAGQAFGGLAGPGWVLIATGEAVTRILTTPFVTLVVVLLYFDSRIRKEGLDLALMAREIGAASPTGA